VLTHLHDFVAEPAEGLPPRFTGGAEGISSFSDMLLRGGAPPPAQPLANTVYSTMVRSAEMTATGTWRLKDRHDADLGEFDWLVITSTAFAHPRWTALFGGKPPLVAAAETMGDRSLDSSLSAVGLLTAKPVTACLMAFENEAAAAWAKLPFFKCSFEGNPTLARVVVQRIHPRLTTVVLHSTHDFAETAIDVYGAKSTAARIDGAMTDADREQAVLSEMLQQELLVPHLLSPSDIKPAWGPHLHRWGSAFPGEPLLAAEHAFLPSAHVAFSGDFVAAERAGTVEGAVLSGLSTAAKIAESLA